MCVVSSPIAAQQVTGSAVDVKGQRHVAPAGREYPWLSDRTFFTEPDYTYEDRVEHRQGTGLFRMIIDSQTGTVTQVKVIRSTGFPSLDYRAMGALHKWRWKPGTWQQVDMPVTFTLARRR
jgi:TonB family protein